MAAKNKTTWIAVMDGTQARFFALRRGEDGQVFEEAASALAAKRAGRSDKPGRGYSAAGGRHAVEPKSDPQKLDTLQFIRQVAETLDTALGKARYEQLVLVAPPRNLAELRDHLTARVHGTLAHQIPKNLTNLATEALWEKLSLILLKVAKPVSTAASRGPAVLGNSLPVSVVFRNMDVSPTAQTAALNHAAKLGRRFGRILNCRITVEAPKHAHRKVKEFRVAIDMKLPGHEIATKSGEGVTHSDLSIALRDAFDAATRQLQNHVRRLKDGVLRERRKSSPRVRGYAEA